MTSQSALAVQPSRTSQLCLAFLVIGSLSAVAITPRTSYAQFTASGYAACVSLPTYRELENAGFADLPEYTLRRRVCRVLSANAPVSDVSYQPDHYVRFRLDGTLLWSNRHAIRRRLQPKVGNIFVDGRDDVASLCSMISLNTRAYADPSHALAASVLSVHRDISESYVAAVRTDDYELVVHQTEGRCVAELDIINHPLLACHVDAAAYYPWLPEAKRKDPAGYQSLCLRPVTALRASTDQEYDSVVRTLGSARPGQEEQAERERSAILMAIARYMDEIAGRGRVATTEASCARIQRLAKTDPLLARNLAGQVVNTYDTGKYEAFRSYGGPVAKEYEAAIVDDEFSFDTRWQGGDCLGIFKPHSDRDLPLLPCVLKPEAIIACLDKTDMLRGFCLIGSVCVKEERPL